MKEKSASLESNPDSPYICLVASTTQPKFPERVSWFIWKENVPISVEQIIEQGKSIEFDDSISQGDLILITHLDIARKLYLTVTKDLSHLGVKDYSHLGDIVVETIEGTITNTKEQNPRPIIWEPIVNGIKLEKLWIEPLPTEGTSGWWHATIKKINP